MKYLTNFLNAAVGRVSAFAVSATGCLGMSAALALLAGFFAVAMAQQPVDAPHSGLINSAGAAFNAATGKSYVVDSDGNSVEVSNDRTGAARSVKAGSHPVSVAVDSQNGRAYVVNAGDGTVSVLDGETDDVVATVQVGDHPYSIASDSAAGKIYVTRTYSNQLMVINAATNQVSSIEAGSPDLLVIDQKSHTVYLLSYEMGDLAILNGVTHAITRTTVGMHAWGMAINQQTGAVYIAKPGDGRIAVIEPGSTHPAYIETGGLP
jgi:YVTN family beta-propeller protein